MKSVIILVCCLLVWGSGVAQNRSICFEPKNWKQAVAKAKSENKLIFLDCYTSWCGPCKMLAQNIFTQDNVADFYNRHFVNVSIDMEKDPDGVLLSETYKPSAYPTLLFIDPFTELVVHRKVGGGSADDILSLGKMVLESDNTLAGSYLKYMRGNREEQFVIKLMNDLKLAGDVERHRLVVEEFFRRLSDVQIGHEKYWKLLKEHLDSPYGDLFQRIAGKREYYESLYGKQEVADVLYWTVIVELGNVAKSSYCGQDYEQLLRVLKEYPFPGLQVLWENILFAQAIVDDEYAKAWEVMEQSFLGNAGDGEVDLKIGFYLRNPLAALMPSMEGAFILQKIADWLEYMKHNSRSMPRLSLLALNRSLVYRALMNEKEYEAWREYSQYCTMR